MATRRGLSPRSKQKYRDDLYYIQAGRCENRWCLNPKKRWCPDNLELDHIKPLADGGTNEFDNFQLLCNNCHARKTRRENQERAKAKNAPKAKRRRRRRLSGNQPILSTVPVVNPHPVRSSGTMSGGARRSRSRPQR